MRKILIFNRLGIGDVVLTTPLAEILKKNGDFQIGYVVAAKAADVLFNHPYIDDVFSYSKQDKQAVLAAIKAKEYREALIVDGRLSSTIFALKSGCRPLNWGFEITVNKQKLLKRRSRAVYALNDFASYSKFAGITPDFNGLRACVGDIAPERKSAIDVWLEEVRQKTRKVVLIAPKTAADVKNWRVAHLAKLNTYLNAHGVLPIYIGAKSDADYIETIDGGKINAAGRFSLRELPYLARRADFALSMCTGPLHVLGTTELPVIAIYGPSDPKRWAPSNAIVVQSALPCVPCSRWADCARTAGDTCMDEILPERVQAIIEERQWL